MKLLAQPHDPLAFAAGTLIIMLDLLNDHNLRQKVDKFIEAEEESKTFFTHIE